MRSLRGHFLIASAELLDPNFERSVVLLLKHDIGGALGVIINAPLTISVADALGESVESAQTVEAPLHQGGPCQGPMLVLHGDESGVEILPGVKVIESRDDIEALMNRDDVPDERVRYIVGYAGWGYEQLETELSEGSWLTVGATADEVFIDPADQWERLTTKANLTKFIPPDQIPDEPGLN